MKGLQNIPVGDLIASNGPLRYAHKDKEGKRNELSGISILVIR